jgi:predicted dehydrogenase
MPAFNKIKLAIAGAGMVTRYHLNAWAKLSRVEIVAICARHLESARARATEFNIPGTYDDVATMLDREKPDALDIATPPEVHARQVELAAQRDIDVLCQKPMCPDLAEAMQLVARVGDRIRFMVHENWRFRPQYRQAARWLAEGKIGNIREFHLSTHSSGLVTRTAAGRLFALERQPFLADLKRLIINELLIHHLDTIRFLAGPLHVVAASAERICPEVIGEDKAHIRLAAASGAIGTVSGNFCAAGFPALPTDRLELIGERASIIFDDNLLKLIGDEQKSMSLDLEVAYQQSYDNAIAHFVACLQSGKPFETDRLDNLKTLQLVSDAYNLAGL